MREVLPTRTGEAASQGKVDESGALAAFLYCTPVILLLFGSLVFLSKPSAETAKSGAAFMDDPSRLLMMGTAYAMSGMLVMMRVQMRLVMSSGMMLLGVILLYIFLSAAWSSVPPKVLVNWVHHLGLTFVAIAATQYCRATPGRLYVVIVILFSILNVMSVIVSVAVPAIGIDALTGRWQGVISNPNHLGAVGSITVWATAFCLVCYKSPGARVMCGFALFFAFVVLAGSGSMTSIATMMGGTGLFVFLLIARRVGPMARFTIIATGAWFFLMGVVAVFLINPDAFSVGFLLSSMGRDPTLTGRTDLWELALGAFADSPIFGWSFDSLVTVLSVVHMHYGQFHNGYLDLLVKGGLIGLGLVFALLARYLTVLIRLLQYNYEYAASGIGIFMILIVYNITEAALLRESSEIWEVVMFHYVLSESVLKRIQVSEKKPQGSLLGRRASSVDEPKPISVLRPLVPRPIGGGVFRQDRR